jgi:hypothetical protein
VRAERRWWGILPPVPQYDRGGGGKTQTRDRHPSYSASGAGYDGAATSRFGANAQRTPPRAHTFSPATRLHDIVQKELSRSGPYEVRKAWRRDGDVEGDQNENEWNGGNWDQHQNQRNGSRWGRRR